MEAMPNDRPLPRPTSGTELYLAAVLDELKAIKLQLVQPEPEPDEGEEIELREVPQVFTVLPENFPGYDALTEAGVLYLEMVPRLGADLIEIPGIGKATANKILTWFKV